MSEGRTFPPDPDFSSSAHIKSFEEYEKLYKESIEDPERFWGKQADILTWQKKWDTVLEWKAPFCKWFTGGRLNVSENCLDRHLESRGDKVAILWESEQGDVKTFTYKDLHAEVCKFSNVLKNNGIQKGDRVILYLPMIPEAAIAMLSCARIGAVHSVVFGGFSAKSLRTRVQDCEAKIVITSDGSFRGGKTIPLKANVDEALSEECE